MHDWMFDIGALVACCLSFYFLISIFRIVFLFAIKIAILAGLGFFGWRTYGSSISIPQSLSNIPLGKIAELAVDTSRTLWQAGEEVLHDARTSTLTSHVTDTSEKAQVATSVTRAKMQQTSARRF